MERMIMLMKEPQGHINGCFIVSQAEPKVELSAINLMAELRAAGIRCEAAFGKSIKAQMRRAGKAGYPACIIMGASEVDSATLTLKDMINDVPQRTVLRKDALAEIKPMLLDKGDNA